MSQKFIIIGILVLLAVAVLVFFVSSSRAPKVGNEQGVTDSEVEMEVGETPSSTGNETTSETEDVATDTGAASAVPEGIHIMPDGTVMAKDGSVVAGATVLSDGTIRLSDGTIVTPIADMRSKGGTAASGEHAPSHVTFDVVGIDFEYDIKQIKVKEGDTVTINFKSSDGFHDWVVDEFAAATERVNEGGSTSVTFVADKTGTFQYYCSVMNHRERGMVGYLIVEKR